VIPLPACTGVAVVLIHVQLEMVTAPRSARRYVPMRGRGPLQRLCKKPTLDGLGPHDLQRHGKAKCRIQDRSRTAVIFSVTSLARSRR
jgi:hypothetical protein